MTEKEILIVRTMREEGRSFGEISERTRLNRNTIKSWCKRYKVVPLETLNVCPQCGKHITNKRRRFCSDECRCLWWKEHPYLKKQDPAKFTKHTCAYCGKTFKVYGKTERKYCSRECYFKGRFGNVTEYNGW